MNNMNRGGPPGGMNRGGPGSMNRMGFPTWNYGMTLGPQGPRGGYQEFRGHGNYVNFGFAGPRAPMGFGGGPRMGGPPPRMGGGPPGMMMPRAPLPDQDEVMPEDVKRSVASQQNKVDKTPGVLIRADDGSLVKIAAPTMAEEADLDKMPEPTRFDKSVQGILNGRNAAMYVAMECRKRQWDLEFELIEADGPVHHRVYSYSLTVGPAGSDDVIVTAGIAKGKREAKRRCCEAMVLKLDDLPPAPPLPPQMMGGFYGRPGFRPRFPPPESEDTIFRYVPVPVNTGTVNVARLCLLVSFLSTCTVHV
jgi:Double-stranded RNA binding motif